jgi:serine/threonine protein kinase
MISNSEYQKRILEIFGSLDFPSEYRNAQFSMTWHPEGKTTKVFELKFADGRSPLAVKLFESGQKHNREIGIYKNYLQGSGLDTPNVIYSDESETCLILQWLEGYQQCDSYAEVDFEGLTNWIHKKYDYFSKLSPISIKLDVRKQFEWMISDPFKTLESSYKQTQHSAVGNLLSITTKIKNSYLKIAGKNYPVILEHGDLEPQNILRDEAGNQKYIDWAAAFRSFGLADIAQLRRSMLLASRLGDFGKLSERLTQNFDTHFLYEVVVFMLIKEALVITYCVENKTIGPESALYLESLKVIEQILPEFHFLENRHA